MRERDDAGAEPLGRPVQLDRLFVVPENAGHAVSGPDASLGEAGGDAGSALVQAGVREPLARARERLGVGGSLCGVEKVQREVHREAAAFAIAFTIGS